MKDGMAHPTNPDLVRREGKGHAQWEPLSVPSVSTTDHGDDPAYRAAVELERIADRYPGTLPDRKSAAAREILLAAECLYIELFRDCGQEARRQKLKGALLLRRWIEKTIERSGDGTTEDAKRARAFMVQDVIEAGVAHRPEAVRIAVEVAGVRGLDLGKAKSFQDAHDEFQAGDAWLQSGAGECPLYWPVTEEDLEALDVELSPVDGSERDRLLADAARLMPSYWKTTQCIEQARRKAAYLIHHVDDPDPDLIDILRLRGWHLPLFDALKTGARLPGDKELREIFAASRR